MEPLIPGLPDDIARECLFRIHYTQFSTLCSVSKAWKAVLLSREFRLHREQHCNVNQLILLKCLNGKIYKLILLELDTNIWSQLPPIPDFPNGLHHSFNFIIASFKWGFVIVGADVPRPFSYKVYVFDFLSVTWQRRADMPAEDIYIHGCTSDRDRSVYVLFKNYYSNTLCIMVYDVMKDKWYSRIKTEEKCGSNMIYQSGKIHFYDGRVNNFDKRVLNVCTWKWEPPQIDFIDKKSLYICLSEQGEWYSFRYDGTLAIYKDFTWKVILKTQVFNSFCCVGMWKNKVLFTRVVLKQMGEALKELKFKKYGKKLKKMEACIMDLKNHKFTAIRAPKELRRVLRADCYL